MLEIVTSGLIQNDEQVKQLAKRYKHIVMPDQDDLDMTHWWILNEDGVEILYVGTHETFATYLEEQKGKAGLPN